MAHLDDEQLSQHLDGSAAAPEHLRHCARCEQRLNALRRAVEAVAVPVPPPPPATREAAITRALAAWEPPDGVVVPAPHTDRARRRVPLPVLAAAAVVVALLVAVPLLSRDDEERLPSAAMQAKGGTEAATAGSDLGAIDEPHVLAARVRAAVEDGAGGVAAPAPVTDDASEGADPPSATARSGMPPCEDVVRRSYGKDLDELVYTASVRWQGVPGVVLTYRVRAGRPPLDHRVFVMAREDCRLLVVQGV